MPTRDRSSRRRTPHWLVLAAAALACYVLGSGPILATAFWLREVTGWTGFYAMICLYAPFWYIGVVGPDSWLMQYIEWWVELFGTVGPG
jgi:hypothetical protein